jgi:hypothetical protein
VAVLLAAAVSALFALDRVGMRVVGRVPEGLPVPAVPAITPGDLALLLPAALGVAVVAYSDNVLTARAFAAKQRHPLDSDQELLALGAANLATGFLQGFPVSSSAGRTTVGHAVGGRSQLTSVVALLAVLVVLTVGGQVLAALPTAALGALVVYAALRPVDVAELHRIGRFRRSELSIALATTTAVLLVGVLYGVLIAAGLSILDLLRRVSRPHDGVLGYVPGLAGLHDIDDYLRQRGELPESGTRRPRRRARNPLAAAEHGSSDRDRPHRRRRRAPALRRARRPRCDPGDGPGEAGPAAGSARRRVGRPDRRRTHLSDAPDRGCRVPRSAGHRTASQLAMNSRGRGTVERTGPRDHRPCRDRVLRTRLERTGQAADGGPQ